MRDFEAEDRAALAQGTFHPVICAADRAAQKQASSDFARAHAEFVRKYMLDAKKKGEYFPHITGALLDAMRLHGSLTAEARDMVEDLLFVTASDHEDVASTAEDLAAKITALGQENESLWA